ncbi:MAG: 3-oxoacyl-ACP reductase FabG [Syntrophomonadaceae bacterium]|nr:3-oxoacyl-ACP reductase FabG [Syntrophomonadaceae bacterium]
MNKNNKKVALVTGGSRGIGCGIVRSLAEAGYNVAFTYNTNKELAERLVQDIGKFDSRVIAVQMSLQDKNTIKKALKSITDEFGMINILINNAGMAQEKPFINITGQDFDDMMAVNLKGPFILCQETIPNMVSNGWGRIINISSIGGQWGGYNQVHYAAAKAGLINLTRSLARIYSSNGITINAVAPGLIHTDMITQEINSESGRDKIKNIPAGRIGETKEVADVVKFLVSEEASYITGQTINVNGGMYFV